MWFIVTVICLVVFYVSGRRYGRHWFAKWQRFALPWRRAKLKEQQQLSIDTIESVTETPKEQLDLSVNK